MFAIEKDGRYVTKVTKGVPVWVKEKDLARGFLTREKATKLAETIPGAAIVSLT